jgi:predicted double-glycine peptidase
MNKVAPDRSKISIQNDDELKYWARHFGVSQEDLRRAIEKVGNSAASVRKELPTTSSDGRTHRGP